MSKEFILVRNEQDNGDILICVANIRSVRDSIASNGAFNSSRILCKDEERYHSSQSAAEVLALIEGEQEQREPKSNNGPLSDDFRQMVEDASTICPMLSSELTRITGENWTVTFFPYSIRFDGPWFFRCIQEDTRFQHSLPWHWVPFWSEMSEDEREAWAKQAAQDVVGKWVDR